MANYATLHDMGIRNPTEIERYTHYASEHTDHLRIVYRRRKGELLAESRKYKFPRTKKTVIVDSGTRETEVRFESSQYLQSAMAELDAIVTTHASTEAIKQVLSDEIAHLEEEVAERIATIKSLVDRIQ